MDDGKVGRGEGRLDSREEVEEWASCEDGWVCVARLGLKVLRKVFTVLTLVQESDGCKMRSFVATTAVCLVLDPLTSVVPAHAHGLLIQLLLMCDAGSPLAVEARRVFVFVGDLDMSWQKIPAGSVEDRVCLRTGRCQGHPRRRLPAAGTGRATPCGPRLIKM